MPDKIPDTLSTLTPLPGRKDGREPRQRRARSNVPGLRANTLPAILPGEKIFRIVPDNATLRRWGRRNGYPVKSYGQIPRVVREEFAKQNAWTVRVVSVLVPGATEYSEFYQVRQGPYIRKQTTDPFYVRRTLGDELYASLKKVRET